MAGATEQLIPRFDPAALAAAIANDGITLMFGVPGHLSAAVGIQGGCRNR